ncbi:hypothetical protein KI387_038818, partial [Taxus chinensis]
YFTTETMEAQLRKTSESINEIMISLNLHTNIYTARNVGQHPEESPLDLLDFIPEGIEEQEAKVKELLDMEGSIPVVAIVLCGIGGVGKSTLALSVIKGLKWTSTDFIFCRVIIDNKTPDKRAHIVNLQQDILYSFTQINVKLKNPSEGRAQLRKAMENKCCFLFIDNVCDIDYVKQLLPKLSPAEQSDEMALPLTQPKQKSRLRILITSREPNLRLALDINSKGYKEYRVNSLHLDAARSILQKEILKDGGKINEHFHDEADLMEEVAKACEGIPLLLSRFGNHLRLERVKESYEKALEALREMKVDAYGIGEEELLSKTLFFLYDAMKDNKAQEAFLDICTYFHGHKWDIVGYIVGMSELEALCSRMLVTRTHSDTVIVHDILRVMGEEKAKGTRITNCEELSDVLEDKSQLKSVKGLSILNEKSSTTLQSADLNAMHSSLRVLHIGDGVRIDGPPCEKPFNNLKYLRLGNVAEFPFKEASQLENLTVFLNASKPGMDLSQLPLSLRLLHYQVPDDLDCDCFARLPVGNLTSLEWLLVRSQKPVKLPEAFELPSSLKNLDLSNCKHVPKTFSHLTALEHLILNNCDMESLPQGFGKLIKLKHLSMESCTNLTSLSEAVGALNYLSVEGCTRLEKLPDNLGNLSALEELNMRDCQNLRSLPEDLSGLCSMQKLDLTGCINLRNLPGSFSRFPLRSLTFESLLSLEELPDSFIQLTMLEALRIVSCNKLCSLPKDFYQLSCLKEMTVENCPCLKKLPDGFESLPALKILSLTDCSILMNLPNGFGELPCLEKLRLENLPLSRLPDGFGRLRSLKALWILNCNILETLSDEFEKLVSLTKLKVRFCPTLEATAMERILKLQNCFLLDIEGSAKLVEQWKEMQQEEQHYYPMVVITSNTLDIEEWRCAATVCLCKLLNVGRDELIERFSLKTDNDTTLAVIHLPIRMSMHQQRLLQRLVDMVKEKAMADSSGKLQVICVRNVESDGQMRNEGQDEESNGKKLSWLPKELLFIPSTDTRLVSLFQFLFFHVFDYLADDKLGCFMAKMQAEDQFICSPQIIEEDEIPENKPSPSPK